MARRCLLSAKPVNTSETQPLYTTGIYTVPEASRLTNVSVGRIRRWIRGYSFKTRNKERHLSSPLWRGEWEPIDHSWALGFRDLIEIRFVDAFLCAGVSWRILRAANESAQERFGDTHPFSSRHFVTDGREIFVELARPGGGEPALLDIIRSQQVFSKIIRPYLRGLEYSRRDELLRWRPNVGKVVILDPKRSFGQPIVEEHGVPTTILASAAKASRSFSEVIHWFGVSEREVADAVGFEQQLAA